MKTEEQKQDGKPPLPCDDLLGDLPEFTPSQAMHAMHSALQQCRPIVAAIYGGTGDRLPLWMRDKSAEALGVVDAAMVMTDLAFPAEDFYAPNDSSAGTKPAP